MRTSINSNYHGGRSRGRAVTGEDLLLLWADLFLLCCPVTGEDLLQVSLHKTRVCRGALLRTVRVLPPLDWLRCARSMSAAGAGCASAGQSVRLGVRQAVRAAMVCEWFGWGFGWWWLSGHAWEAREGEEEGCKCRKSVLLRCAAAFGPHCCLLPPPLPLASVAWRCECGAPCPMPHAPRPIPGVCCLERMKSAK
jgi:hypothetical protein